LGEGECRFFRAHGGARLAKRNQQRIARHFSGDRRDEPAERAGYVASECDHFQLNINAAVTLLVAGDGTETPNQAVAFAGREFVFVRLAVVADFADAETLRDGIGTVFINCKGLNSILGIDGPSQERRLVKKAHGVAVRAGSA